MRLVRAIVNAVLMATLIKPVVRLTLSRWRRRARESAAATVGIPVQELFEAALIEELAGPAADASSMAEEAMDAMAEPAGRSLLRSALIAAVALSLAVAIALTAVRLIRRRRAAQERELVAIPVDASGEVAEEIEEVVAQGALIEQR